MGTSALASPHRKGCNPARLDTSSFNYTFTANDTMPAVASRFNRGICEIARLNRMADPLLVYEGEELTIPAQVCNPDNDSCLLRDLNPTLGCIFGGVHVYQSQLGDTIRKIATEKFNVTIEAVTGSLSITSTGNVGVDEILPVNSEIKLPLCLHTQCIFQPYQLVSGTFVDLAKKFGVTYGQISALNYAYNVSSRAHGATGPTLTMPMNCTTLPGYTGSSSS